MSKNLKTDNTLKFDMKFIRMMKGVPGLFLKFDKEWFQTYKKLQHSIQVQ